MPLSTKALRHYRETAGFSARQAAVSAFGCEDKRGVGRRIFGYERGERVPNAATLGKLAACYGCSVGDFYEVNE